MASRAEIARAIARLQTSPGYRDYVKTLEVEREAAVYAVIHAEPDTLLDARANLRVLDSILTSIKQNEIVT